LVPDAQKISVGAAVHKVGYNGRPGAFADVACEMAFPTADRIAMPSLETTIASLVRGEVDRILLPCENSLVGRVPDVHKIVPDSGLHIVGEHFQRVEHCLMAPAGATLASIRRVRSHPVALGQVSRLIAALDLEAIAAPTTSHAAELVASREDPSEAAIASDLAANLYGLNILKRNVEDDPHNTTRFYVLSAEPQAVEHTTQLLMTTIVFRTQNRPGCLYHAIAGFADNGINMTKIESYLVGGQFVPSRFLCEFEGDPAMPEVADALDILARHARELVVLGTFPMASHHLRNRSEEDLHWGTQPPAAFRWSNSQQESLR
jgi:prephenate dehydratase